MFTFIFFFFFNDTATTEIYTLSLHDALPISSVMPESILKRMRSQKRRVSNQSASERRGSARDRKSTRLNSSHSQISYAVFCLKKKKNTHIWHCYLPVSHFVLYDVIHSVCVVA